MNGGYGQSAVARSLILKKGECCPLSGSRRPPVMERLSRGTRLWWTTNCRQCSVLVLNCNRLPLEHLSCPPSSLVYHRSPLWGPGFTVINYRLTTAEELNGFLSAQCSPWLFLPLPSSNSPTHSLPMSPLPFPQR